MFADEPEGPPYIRALQAADGHDYEPLFELFLVDR
jgi:hypothetical protein